LSRLNAKAALFAIDEYYEESGCPGLPVMISGTIVDMSGRTLSGQTTEAFYVSMQHAKPVCIGLNCALGADQMLPFMQALANVTECLVHSYPNAGLPNAMGGYDETPGSFAKSVKLYLDTGLVNMLGGCCGTTPPRHRRCRQDAQRTSPLRCARRSPTTARCASRASSP
jgi:5-methyltetrahydrofolate--homocysteine methyltransferase